jgi:phosphohistidine phosphatase
VAERRIVYLVRHGVAAERGPEYPDDRLRPLTSEGKDKVREIAAGLAAIGVHLDEILTSPLVRTRQTAEILAGAWSPVPAVRDLDGLAVDGRNEQVLSALAARRRGRQVALVGHMPGIGSLAAELIGSASPFPFRKGAVAGILLGRDPRRGDGTLLWFAPPKLLRLAGPR